MTVDLILQEARGMSDDVLMEVVHYMRFLKIVTYRKPMDHYSGKMTKKYREAGKYRGKGWMAADFDAPLEDFKEYM